MADEKLLTVFVHLSDDGTLSYKPNIKGARWRAGFESMEKIADDCLKASIPFPHEIDFLTDEERARA